MNDSAPEALDVVTGVVARLGRLIGHRVRVTPDATTDALYGTLSAFRLAQDGGRNALYVLLREHAGEVRIAHIEPAGLAGGREQRALPDDREE